MTTNGVNELNLFLYKLTDDQRLRGFSEGTIRCYEWHIGKLFDYLESQNCHSVREVTTRMLENYVREVSLRPNTKDRKKTLSKQTVNGYIQCIKGFFQFLRKKHYLQRDPSEPINYVKTPKLVPTSIIDHSTAMKIIEAPNCKTVLGFRDRTALELLYSTGIRRNEFRHLLVEDVDFDKARLLVRVGKGNKQRYVPIGRHALAYLLVYLDKVRPLMDKKRAQEAWLFLSKKGDQFGNNTLGGTIERYAKQVGITQQVTPHTFRRAVGTELAKNEIPPSHLKDILGHADYSSLDHYVKLDTDSLRKAVLKYHPRENE